jgi:hypothetical protein
LPYDLPSDFAVPWYRNSRSTVFHVFTETTHRFNVSATFSSLLMRRISGEFKKLTRGAMALGEGTRPSEISEI